MTGINAPGTQALTLQRHADCSLSLYTGTYSFNINNPAISVQKTTAKYERVLHSEAQLETTADSFPKGCKDPTTGTSSQRATYFGKTTDNLYFFERNVHSGELLRDHQRCGVRHCDGSR